MANLDGVCGQLSYPENVWFMYKQICQKNKKVFGSKKKKMVCILAELCIYICLAMATEIRGNSNSQR